MNVGIFSPYLKTLGGGERYIFTVLEFFLNRKDSVSLFTSEGLDFSAVKERYGIDLSGTKIVKSPFGAEVSFFNKLWCLAKYDLVFYLSDGSFPFSLARRNIVHFQVPLKVSNARSFWNKIKLARINSVLCNSGFTKNFIDLSFGITSNVLYPPVDIDLFERGKKENLVISVGRFFSPSHPKKQEVLIEAFKKLVDSGLTGWRMELLGGLTLESKSEVSRLEKIIGNYPIEIFANAPLGKLQASYAKAKIYWHAAGFGEDLQTHPELAEHFGISTVEGMSAGCVPVVYAGGGQLEIVEDQKSGFLWTSLDELLTITKNIAKDAGLQKKISDEAIIRSKLFSKENFFKELAKYV